MKTTVEKVNEGILERRGWKRGTSLENQVAVFLSGKIHWAYVRQQYPVGRYRLDFAFPGIKLDLECDGPFHFNPDGAMKDAIRDAWLRSRGWMVVRVDNRNGERKLLDSLVPVTRLLVAWIGKDADKCPVWT